MTEKLYGLSDQSLLRYYEDLREQIAADLRSGYRFMGEPAKERANALLAEIRRRGLKVEHIYWPPA
jgi:hypothetical protein